MALLQNGKAQFFDANGRPLAGGTVDFYVVNTTTRKDTFLDQAMMIPNSNPVVLDARGEATIWGTGVYRQVLKDAQGNTIWDVVSESSDASAVDLVASLSSDLANATDPAKGDALIGVNNTPTGVSTTQHWKNAERLSLWDFIPDSQKAAIQDGTSVYDATAAVQAAADAAKASIRKTIEVPAGLYNVQHVDFIGSDYSGIHFVAAGGKPTFKWKKPAAGRQTIAGYPSPTFARYNAADGMFLFNSNANATTDDTSSIKDIYFLGIRFQADVVSDGFDQLMHLVCGYGVSRMAFDFCDFIGFMGDGVSVVRGLTNGGNANAYNSDVRIRNCYFDGVNQQNRNGISAYYCDGGAILDCDFRNTTRSDMPGAIDIEPDNALTRTRNWRIIGNRFNNIGGTGGAVTWHSPDAAPYPHTGLEVSKNHFEGVQAPLFAVTLYATNSAVNAPSYIWFHDNTINNAVVSFDVRVRGVTIERNLFKQITTTTRSSGNNCQDVYLRNNTWDTVSYPGGVFFGAAATNVQFVDNTFYNMAGGAIMSSTVGGVTRIKGNNFASSQTANSIPYNLAAGGPSAYGQIDLGGNTFGTNFVQGLSIYGLCNNNTEITKYSQLNPQNMPYGRNSFWSNGDYPTTGYGGRYTGQCVTFNDPNQTAIGGVVEVFYPSDDVVHFFVRRATGATTWGQWKDYVGTPTS
ncbi:hypothetical protein KTE26_14370 [Ralstonia mannitolilytica]|uniref:hypothetical protein n=2 Tax=Pseudomonadota TaxID=1224 RepID=UPI001C22BAFE|nr:hypothetical protein [Ralstonia mannitolilytica]MBU9579616.1 hypothetical protein [Ralstonia mannitolilytica]